MRFIISRRLRRGVRATRRGALVPSSPRGASSHERLSRARADADEIRRSSSHFSFPPLFFTSPATRPLPASAPKLSFSLVLSDPPPYPLSLSLSLSLSLALALFLSCALSLFQDFPIIPPHVLSFSINRLRSFPPDSLVLYTTVSICLCLLSRTTRSLSPWRRAVRPRFATLLRGSIPERTPRAYVDVPAGYPRAPPLFHAS